MPETEGPGRGANLTIGDITGDGRGEVLAGAPDSDVHAFINDRERRVGTYLFGRKVYETMAVWDTPEIFPDPTATMLEYVPIWQAAEKIVYSTTLPAVSAPKTRLERKFDADVVRELKAAATRGSLSFASCV